MVNAIICSMLAVSSTSARTKAASPLARRIASATRSPPSALMSARTTLAPSRAKVRAVASPMPDAAPLISATLFASLMEGTPTPQWGTDLGSGGRSLGLFQDLFHLPAREGVQLA